MSKKAEKKNDKEEYFLIGIDLDNSYDATIAKPTLQALQELYETEENEDADGTEVVLVRVVKRMTLRMDSSPRFSLVPKK